MSSWGQRICPIDLDQHCEVTAVAQRGCDRRTIGAEAIGRNLKMRGRGRQAQAFNENVSGRLVPLAQRDVQNQFRVPLYRDKGVGIAHSRIVFRSDTLLFFPDVAPKLITFHVLYFYVANLLSHDPFALLTGEDQQLEDRRVMNFRDAFDTRNAVALKQEFQNHLRFLDWQVHTVKRVVPCIGEYLAALRALVTLTVLALPEFTAFGTAIVAGHFEPCFLQGEGSK